MNSKQLRFHGAHPRGLTAKEAGVICFDLRIPWKIPKNYYATVPSKFDGSNVRHTVSDSWSYIESMSIGIGISMHYWPV